MERLTIRNSEGIGVLKQPFECERCGDLQWSLPDFGMGSPIDRLAEYEDLEEQGKLLKLPCVPGGAVWIIENEKISKCGVSTVTVQDGRVSFWNAVYICDLSDFGKTVFLTKEEAEAALKGERSE